MVVVGGSTPLAPTTFFEIRVVRATSIRPVARPAAKAGHERWFAARFVVLRQSIRSESTMLEITLPDGSKRSYERAVSILDVASDVGPGLAKAAVAGSVDGKTVDLSHMIDTNASVSIITGKDEAGLEVIRHSTAHLLAQAAKQLYPDAQVTIGPVIEDGFYYDFAFERGFTEDDLAKIEKRMKLLAAQNMAVKRSVIEKDAAIEKFKRMGEHYKSEIIRDLPDGEEITLYSQGDFVDLCRGPHVPSTRHLKAFKLTKVAGAYWRGDSSNEMLQRIYGTAWASKADLNEYLHRLEEAQRRDHRKLGRELDLFHFQEEAPGMVFWHERGWQLYRTVESYMRDLLGEYGYTEVHTPQLLDRSLWERSGHWETFAENMFTTEIEERAYALKPMNCPGHVQMFNQGLRSYRNLPYRIAEFGHVHRYEASGTLHGLLRVRRFTQDDAHVFCTEEQIQSEVEQLIASAFRVYNDFGFEDIAVALSTRPEKRVGGDALWDQAETALDAVLRQKGIEFATQEGEGAFYGPKIDFVLNDCIGRKWQCGTIQLDFSMPGRLGAEFVDSDGSKKVPVMIHRALLGSLERFVGILIEQHAGRFPVWLAPVQAAVMNISQNQSKYASNLQNELRIAGIRAISDLRNEKIGFKIREQTLNKIPFLVVIGDREVADRCVSVRTREGEDLGSMAVESLTAMIRDQSTIKNKEL